jgi:hypothetical protein
MTTQYVSARAEIFDLLARVETLLQEVTCEGEQLAELECFEEVDTAFAHLVQTIDYYID